MFDVFYFGSKPDLFPFEQPADSLEHAAEQSKTEFFWYIYGSNDYGQFNFHIKPVPWEQEHVYVYPSQWQPDAGVYLAHKEHAHKRIWNFRQDQYVNRLPDKTHWVVPEEIDEASVDFTWHPNPHDPAYNYHFGDDYQESSGLIYQVPGATDIKLLEGFNTKTVAPDIFFIDKLNQQSTQRFESLKQRYPNAQKVRYMNSMLETIKRCVVRSGTSKFWVISSENNYDTFDFAWHANSWQGYMTHVFGSRLQKWSDTYLINKHVFERNAKWAKSIAEFPDLNFVTNQYVVIPEDLYDVYYIDHNNAQQNKGVLLNRFPKFKTTRFVDNYLDTLKRIVATATTEYVWVTSSLCDYTKFDFSWQPEPWQADMLHVFASKNQKFGDTFYIPVAKFKQQMDQLELLDWFDTVNYCNEQVVPYIGLDIVRYDSDSLVDVVKAHTFTAPYAVFTTTGEVPDFVPSVWRKKDRAVHTFTRSGSISIVPRDIQAELSSQLYDYPYIIKHKDAFLAEKSPDIVFISYDEPQAEENWTKLVTRFPEAKRVHGVEGMERALLRAAEISDTPWYYAVFAKTELAPEFDFSFKPDYFQEPKHYIFHSYNVMNGLEYGHMGIVMYNCNIVKNIKEFGIDYTLSAKHEVVPVVSAIASFNSNPYQTWRTAFREASKLAQYIDENRSIETRYRLNVWTSKAEGEYAEWCLRGARDGKEFYEQHRGDDVALKQAFDWRWLKTKFASHYDDVDNPNEDKLKLRQSTWRQ